MVVKVKKIVGAVLAVLAVLMVILLSIFLFWLGPAVKMVAEHIGSKALGTPLTINELKINPRHGTFHMTGFAIGNPDEFGQTNAVSLAGMDIALDIGSIFSRTVVVHRVQIDSPYFIYEQNEASDNVTEFMKNLEEYLGGDAEKPEPRKPDEDDSKEPKIVIVEQLEVNDIQFHLAHTDATNMDINVGIEQVAASMTNGIATVKNLHVSNPSLLETPNLFRLDGIEIEVDPASIYSDRISIRDVQVIRPYAYLERNPQTDTVTEFMKIADRFANAATNAPAAMEPVVEETTETEETATGAPPFELHNLLVDDIQIKLLDSTATNTVTQPRMLAGIGSIAVKLVDGHIQLKGISIPNPDGYLSTNLFQLAGIDVSLDPDSLFSGQVNIEKILVNSPEINLEQTETSGNVADLQASLMGFASPAGAVDEAPSPEATPQTGEGPEPIPLDEQPVVLHSLLVTNFAINLTLPAVTNKPVQWALDMSEIQKLNPMNKLSLGKLNIFAPGSAATNETEAAEETDDGGPLKLVAFKLLSVRPLEGVIQLDGLTVANPHGFTYRHLVELGQFRLELDPDTLQSDTLVIKEILIGAPNIVFERHLTTDNIKDLQAEIKKLVSQQQEEPEENAPTQPVSAQQEAGGQKVIIKHLQIKKGTVRPKLSVLPAPSIPLSLELSNIGEDTGGTSISGMLSDLGSISYDFIIGTVANSTDFATDTLKGAGALTFGSLLNLTSGDTEEGMTGEDKQVTDQSSNGNTVIEEPEKDKRSRGRHRLPGRSF